MSHKCYISFKTEDMAYKRAIQNMGIDMIDKSLNSPINSSNEDYIMRRIREDYLCDSTVTIFLIGKNSAENSPSQNQIFIKRELQASLYNGTGNTRNGILGIVLPEMMDTVFTGSYTCTTCGKKHNGVAINDSTTIKEFNRNYYIPSTGKCSWSENERYCVLVGWSDFVEDPEYYINQAFNKRFSEVAKKVVVYPK